MENVLIEKKEETKDGWIFEVVVGMGSTGRTRHSVIVPKKYWQKLTRSTNSEQASKTAPEELVRRSFIFLLEREPKEQILKEFALPLMQKYFSEYESEISTT